MNKIRSNPIKFKYFWTNNGKQRKNLLRQFLLIFTVLLFYFLFPDELYPSLSNPTQNNIKVEKDENYNIDVIHYKINIEFKPDEKIILFENEIEFQIRNNNIDKISFDYNPIILIKSVKDANGQNLKYKRIPKSIVAKTLNIYITPISNKEKINVKYYIPTDEEEIFFDVNKNWWLSRMQYYDFATAEISITSPAEYMSVSQGLLQKEEIIGSSKKSIWRINHPALWFGFAIAKYERKETTHKGKKISFFYHKEYETLAKEYLDITKNMVSFLSEKYGEYPFDKLAVCETPTIGGGVANQSLIFVGSKIFKNRDLFMHVVSHEIGHQWWALLVARTQDEGWLTNGFAEFSRDLFLSYFKKDKKLVTESRKRRAELYLKVLDTPADIPLKDTTLASSYPVHYGKGPFVVHMLRYVLGDDSFFKALKNFLKEFSYRVVTINEFKENIEKSTNQDLNWFFEEWFNKKGAPYFEMKYEVKQIKDKKFQVNVTITQSDDVYNMPADITFVYPKKRETKRIILDSKNNEFVFYVNQNPESLIFDEEYQILKRIKI